jgi:hypothetical protein
MNKNKKWTTLSEIGCEKLLVDAMSSFTSSFGPKKWSGHAAAV